MAGQPQHLRRKGASFCAALLGETPSRKRSKAESAAAAGARIYSRTPPLWLPSVGENACGSGVVVPRSCVCRRIPVCISLSRRGRKRVSAERSRGGVGAEFAGAPGAGSIPRLDLFCYGAWNSNGSLVGARPSRSRRSCAAGPGPGVRGGRSTILCTKVGPLGRSRPSSS